MLISYTEKQQDHSSIFLLVADYNTYIKKLQLEVVLDYFELKNTTIVIDYLTGFNHKDYKFEGEDVIDLPIERRFPEFEDNHNLKVKGKIDKWMQDKTNIDLLVLANIQGIDEIFNDYKFIRYVMMYGGRKFDTISYNWKRSVNELNMFFPKIREYGKHVYIMTPNVIYGNQQPDVLSVYNKNKSVSDSYINLMSVITSKYPKVRTITDNWNKRKGLRKFVHQKTAIDVPVDEFVIEMLEGSSQMTPADICTITMYFDILENNTNYKFENYSNLKIIDINGKYSLETEEKDDKIFHICCNQDNDNFVNRINNLTDFLKINNKV